MEHNDRTGIPSLEAGRAERPSGIARASYPRPQFRRARWLSLDGIWKFSRTSVANDPEEVSWDEQIRVPFSPEAPLSGIGDQSFHPVVWYCRSFELPPGWSGQRVILHFGAVDYRATVWLNGHLVTQHEGGHTSFSADVTTLLRPGRQELCVRAEDDPAEMDKPRGKQDWLREPHAIWYPRTTGIWQTVWLEPIGSDHLQSVRYDSTVDTLSLGISVDVAGEWRDAELEVTVSLAGSVLARDRCSLQAPRLVRSIGLPDPGIDDARKNYLWSPESPTLLDVEFRLTRDGEVLDEVSSYTALREVAAHDGRFLLNGRPYFLRLVLDQGYWEDGLLTAPDDDALRRDVEMAKALGFNGVRKHQKLEDPRYHYWADRLGLLVWAELPSALSFGPRTVARLTREWMEAIEANINHPCIVTWVPFNESWGIPDLPVSAQQRDAVRALHALTKSLDPSRPVVGNDGWEFVVGDIFTIHDYSPDPDQLARRYRDRETVELTVKNFRPAGRTLLLDNEEIGGRPVVLSEFGGIRLGKGSTGWGYSRVESSEELLERYTALIEAASGPGLAGFCYTQFSDTFQEQNGLVSMERVPKADFDSLARATRGEGR